MMTSYRERLKGVFAKKGPSAALTLKEAGFTVLDTELTGLDVKKDSIISVGAVRMTGGRIDLGSTFYRLINPPNGIDHRNVVIHGITPSDVAEKPEIAPVLRELAEYCGDDIIVGHFISLDMSFIARDLRRSGFEQLKNPVVDTCSLYNWTKANEASFSRHFTGKRNELDLFALAREYGITFSEGHNALSDAFITAQLFQRLLSQLPGLGVHSVKDLLTVGKP